MFRNINKKISLMLKETARLEPLKQELDSYYAEFKKQSLTMDKFRKQLETKISDIGSLKGNSLKSIIYSIFGKKDEKLRKEQKELKGIEIDCEKNKKRLEAIKKKMDRLWLEIKKIHRIKEKLEILLVRKEKLIKEKYVDAGFKLNKLSDVEVELAKNIKAMDKALMASLKASFYLSRAIGFLRKAKSVAWLTKKQGDDDHYEDSLSYISRSQIAMSDFLRSLNDLSIKNIFPDCIVEPLSCFAKLYFKNTPRNRSQWEMIDYSLGNIRRIKSTLKELQTFIKYKKKKIENQLNIIQRKRKAFIMRIE